MDTLNSNGKKRVVITRVGVVSPIGNCLEDFVSNSLNGFCGIRKISKWDKFPWFKNPEAVKVYVAGEVDDPIIPENILSKKEQRRNARFVRFGVAAANEAFNHSRYSTQLFLPSDDPYRVGIIMGTGAGGQEESESEMDVLVNSARHIVSPFTIINRMPNSVSAMIAQLFEWENGFKIRGDNYVTTTACSSSLRAIGNAFRAIRDGYLVACISGGVEAAQSPLSIAGFYVSGALTENPDPSTACRPFSKLRNGFVMGEGCGILVLESLEHALARNAEHEILAEVVGYGSTCDAYHITAPHPSGDGAYKAMALACVDAGIIPNQIGYVNAHGTSTPLNDKIETLAIKRLFADYDSLPPVSSSKSKMGHTIGAAGALESIDTILALKNSMIPPTIGWDQNDPEQRDPDCDLDYVPIARSMPDMVYGMKNNFGFGGHNDVVIYKKI